MNPTSKQQPTAAYSVLMSVYHREDPTFLRAAIQSMLNQTVPSDDFVIVCDGPLVPALDEVLAQFDSAYPGRFQFLRLPENRGLGIALGLGTSLCRHELVARMDTDDLAVPDRMEKQLRAFAKDPSVSVVGGQIVEFESETGQLVGERQVPLDNDAIRRYTAKRNPLNHMTVTFRKKDVEAVGGYCDFERCEDYYLWARLLANGYRMKNLDEISVYVRVNTAFYKRRAGKSFYRQLKRLQAYLYDAKLATRRQCMEIAAVRFVGMVLISARARRFLYNTLLRKTYKADSAVPEQIWALTAAPAPARKSEQTVAG